MTSIESTTATEPAPAAPQAAPVTPKQATSTRKATRKKKATGAQKRAKAAKSAGGKKAGAGKPAAKAPATAPRADTKKATVLALLRRKDGATLDEIMQQTGWARHSVRGFISGTVSKRMGLKVESTKNEAGERTYHIAK